MPLEGAGDGERVLSVDSVSAGGNNSNDFVFLGLLCLYSNQAEL